MPSSCPQAGGAAHRAGLADALVDDVEGAPGSLPLLVHRSARALAEAGGQRPHPCRLPEVGRRSWCRRRLAEGLRSRARRAQQLVRAVMLRLVGEDEATRRSPLRSARRARSGAQRGRGRRARDAGRQRLAGLPCRKETSRSPTRRCCASGHAYASGSEAGQGRRLRRHITQAAPNGTRPAIKASCNRAPASLPPSTGPPIALDVNELEREFVTESREASEKETTRVRRTNRRLRGLLAGVAVLLAAATAGGSSPSSSAVKPETRRRRSSPSALGPRRSSRTTSTARSCSPVRRSRSTVRRRPELSAPSSLPRAESGQDHARPNRVPPRGRGQPGRQDARGWQLRRRTSSSTPGRTRGSAESCR